MTDNIQAKILDLLHPKLEELGLTTSDVDLSESLLSQGILDSMSFLEFMMELEANFELEFDFSEMDPSEFTSVESLTQLIQDGN